MEQDVTIDLSGTSVVMGMPAGRDLHPFTVRSMIGTFAKCQKMNIPLNLGMVAGSSVIQWARSEVVDLFLQTDANRLFWIDSDMVWDPEDFIRLLALSTKVDVVCAAYTAKKEQPTFFINYDAEKGMAPGELGLIEIWGTGLGFTVMSREVIQKLVDKAPKVRDGATGRVMADLFRVDTINGERRGEDNAFFADIRQLGYKVWLDTGIHLGHMGMREYRGEVKTLLRPVV